MSFSDLGFTLILVSGFFGLGVVMPLLPFMNRIRNANDPATLPLGVRFSLWFAFAGSVWCTIPALRMFLQLDLPRTITIMKMEWVSLLPPLSWQMRLDNLSAFFILMVGFFSAAVALYSLGALRAKHYQKQVRRIASGFCLFAWATLMTIFANDLFTLIAALEVMTLAFGFLTMFKHNLYQEPGTDHDIEKVKNARLAPQVYLIISHTSTVLLLAALTMLAIKAESISFDDFRAFPIESSLLQSCIFLLALAGLGIRAGLSPAHIWVSLVHPNSPTTTHAFSLGIAIKVSIYLMFRFFFQFLVPQTWWGYLILIVAATTAFINVWYAIASHDLKTALAYHSVENIAIIVFGMGLTLIFFNDPTWAAVLGMFASLYHILNHALFKGLLYFSTGSIDNLTGQTVEFNRLGGLIRFYPWTSALFLVGSYAIAGLPPFNGFISEWLTLQAALNGMGLSPNQEFHAPRMLIIVFSLALLTASFALTTVCFFKMAGTSLLGRPRSLTSYWQKPGRDSPFSMLAVMAVFAVLCLVLGLFPGWVIGNLLTPVVRELGCCGQTGLADSLLNLGVSGLPSAALPLPRLAVFLLVGGIIAGVVYWLYRLINHRSSLDVWREDVEPWNCATPTRLSMQPSSDALVFLEQDTLASEMRDGRKLAPEYLPARLSNKSIEYFCNGYNAAWDWIRKVSQRIAEQVHTGDIRRSLLYIFLTNLMAMLLFLAYKFLGK